MAYLSLVKSKTFAELFVLKQHPAVLKQYDGKAPPKTKKKVSHTYRFRLDTPSEQPDLTIPHESEEEHNRPKRACRQEASRLVQRADRTTAPGSKAGVGAWQGNDAGKQEVGGMEGKRDWIGVICS